MSRNRNPSKHLPKDEKRPIKHYSHLLNIMAELRITNYSKVIGDASEIMKGSTEILFESIQQWTKEDEEGQTLGVRRQRSHDRDSMLDLLLAKEKLYTGRKEDEELTLFGKSVLKLSELLGTSTLTEDDSEGLSRLKEVLLPLSKGMAKFNRKLTRISNQVGPYINQIKELAELHERLVISSLAQNLEDIAVDEEEGNRSIFEIILKMLTSSKNKAKKDEKPGPTEEEVKSVQSIFTSSKPAPSSTAPSTCPSASSSSNTNNNGESFAEGDEDTVALLDGIRTSKLDTSLEVRPPEERTSEKHLNAITTSMTKQQQEDGATDDMNNPIATSSESPKVEESQTPTAPDPLKDLVCSMEDSVKKATEKIKLMEETWYSAAKTKVVGIVGFLQLPDMLSYIFKTIQLLDSDEEFKAQIYPTVRLSILEEFEKMYRELHHCYVALLEMAELVATDTKYLRRVMEGVVKSVQDDKERTDAIDAFLVDFDVEDIFGMT